jgi:hypothetical protein
MEYWQFSSESPLWRIGNCPKSSNIDIDEAADAFCPRCPQDVEDANVRRAHGEFTNIAASGLTI